NNNQLITCSCRLNFTQVPYCFAGITQYTDGLLQFVLWYHYQHAYATVKGAVHFVAADIALLLQPVKNGRPLPALAVNNSFGICRYHARNMFPEASAGNMAQCMYRGLLKQV